MKRLVLAGVVGLAAAGGVAYFIRQGGTQSPTPLAMSPAITDAVPPPTPSAASPLAGSELTGAEVAALQNPRDAELAVTAGGEAGNAGQHARALAWFQKAERLNPRLLPAIVGQGQMWMELGRPGLAARKYEQALKLAPNETGLLLEAARAYTQLRDFDSALKYADAAQRLAPTDETAWRALANIRAERLGTDDAIAAIDKACELAPREAENWATRGGLLLRARRFPEAEASLRKAVSINPGHAAAAQLLAQHLVDRMKTPAADREAFAILAQLRLADPSDAQAALLQAQILTRANQSADALSLLRQARLMDPRNPTILQALSQALVRSGKNEEGVRLSAEAQKLGPRGVAFLDLEELVRKNPDPALVERLADLYRRQELYDSAILVLERAALKGRLSPRLQALLKQVRALADAQSPEVGLPQ